MPRGKLRPRTIDPNNSVPGPSEPHYEPQWSIRTMERDDPEYVAWDECRLCACTHVSPCEEPFGPCWWVEETLCSSCENLMGVWPLLRLCDGYGMAAAWAFEPPGQRCDCCPRGDEYNGFGSGPLAFTCPKSCSCHD